MINQSKIKIKIIPPLLTACIFFVSTIGATNAGTTDNYSSGSLLASSNNFELGYLIYRVVENQYTSVATLETDFGGVAPFHPFFTQRLTINDKLFYLSNTIAGFELFLDANGNGFIDSVNEIVYFVMLNATQQFDFSTITKTTGINQTTYEWTSHYYDIDGFPNPGSASSKADQVSDQKKILIQSFNITYTLTETTNTSRLAVKYDIGSFDAYTFHFDSNYHEIRTGTVDLTGLSLSLVYTSVIRSSENVEKVVSGKEGSISDIMFVSDSKVIFESTVNENYTLGTNDTMFPVKTVIANPQTLLSDQNTLWSLTNDYLTSITKWTNELGNFTAVPTEDIPVKEIFNYRIAYPEWNGQIIHHDPIYQANKVAKTIDITNGPSNNPVDGFTTISLGSGLVMIALFLNTRKRNL